MTSFWTTALGVGGIVAIFLYVFYQLYRHFLKLDAFKSRLKPWQTWSLLLVFLVTISGIVGGGLYLYSPAEKRGYEANFDSVKPPLFSEIDAYGDDKFSFPGLEEGATSAKRDGVTLSFAATNPNAFAITVEELVLRVERVTQWSGTMQMGHGTGAAFQPEVGTECIIQGEESRVKITRGKGERYIVTANGDKAHFALKVKAERSGIYSLKVAMLVAGPKGRQQFDVGSTRFALSDKLEVTKSNGMRVYNYIFADGK